MGKITISFDIIAVLVGFSLGIAASFILSALSKAAELRQKSGNLIEMLRDRFGSPRDGRFELTWTVREILGIFSERAAQKWYEARAHLGSGIFISVICAMGLMYVVRFEFESASDSRRGFARKKRYHGLRSYDSLEKAILRDVPKVQETIGEDSFFSGALITGHNFVSL